jgi:hypothetical protein
MLDILRLAFGAKNKKSVSCMKITLSRTADGMNTTDIGYQPPLPMEEMNPGDFHPLREAALIASP